MLIFSFGVDSLIDTLPANRVATGSLLRSMHSHSTSLYSNSIEDRCKVVSFPSSMSFGSASAKKTRVLFLFHTVLEKLRTGEYTLSENETLTFFLAPTIFLRNFDHLTNTFLKDAEILLLNDVDGKHPYIFTLKSEIVEHFLLNAINELEKSENLTVAFSVIFAKFKTSNYEKNEIILLHYPTINWSKISSAAIIIAPDWPVKECVEILQSLFFGRYLGDETGLFLNILHPY